MALRAAYLLFALSFAANLWLALRDPQWLAIPALLAGWYLADLTSGMVHMFMDYHPCPKGKGLDRLYFYPDSRASKEYQTLFRATMKTINPFQRLVYDFKNHHPRPNALGRRSISRQIGSTVVAGSLPASLLFNGIGYGFAFPGWIAAGFCAFIIGGTFAQYFHGTLHRADNPAIIPIMRRLRLLMTPDAHQLHHDSLQRDFSTNCGWSNPLLNPVFYWLRNKGYMRDEGLEPQSTKIFDEARHAG